VTDLPKQYIGDPKNDPLLGQAKSLVIADQRASLSYLQRKLRIGYNRAAAIIEELHRVGVISKPNEQGVRTVLAQA
jgi:S-DNA-T family DNA segregation ATPase FtsK/SpoIIIE